ncbi:uncharacterized protein B0H18DRAFT_1116161 [Fomitopsis serialis]|uniref:uncharacterized protein n=1 Tax=Fomitopsis serialis TaxID=139415 RepID=UPI0020086A52|nr:uncharacterized protein B0H18DRAFT_1116161 [Neoantrodia serialis]KAH9931917.1 hypothetical protein B0H18DRAFT_1116161 [Neoantrodia serialis]
MRFTTSLFAVVTMFCVLFLVQAAPVQPRDNAEVCGKITDCDACVKKDICGFTFTPANASRGIHIQGILRPTLLTLMDILSIPAPAGGGNESRADAEKIWKGMQSHVFDGRSDKSTSGRHLTSTWFKTNKDSGDMVIDTQTSLATVSFGGGKPKKTKTLFIDDKRTGLVNGKQQVFTGKYNRDIVARMCTDGIEESLKENKSKTLCWQGTTPMP